MSRRVSLAYRRTPGLRAAWRVTLAASVALACGCSSPGDQGDLHDLGEAERSSDGSAAEGSNETRARDPGAYRNAERVVAQGEGWRVTTRGGQPVETFGSSDRPAGFEPADPPATRAPREAPREAAPASPWVAAPESEAPAGKGERTPLKTEATGVDLVPGQCGAVPVARYGLDWRPDEEWEPGKGPRPDGWRLRQPPRLPPVPTPEGAEPDAKPVIQEKGVPSGSADPDPKGTWKHVE